ncbi:MAG: DUF5989 family protein [Thiogranum sp.]
MKVRKNFRPTPILLAMLLPGTLIALAQGSAVAPFIYTLLLMNHPYPVLQKDGSLIGKTKIQS